MGGTKVTLLSVREKNNTNSNKRIFKALALLTTTVNPSLTPPPPGLFISNTFDGGGGAYLRGGRI